jgi:glycerol-3-phosphate dehydrogenase subunit C
LTLKEEAPELLDMHDENSQLTATNTVDFNEFLLILLEEGSLNLNFTPLPLTLGYHVPCQYRAHRIGKPGLQIMNLIPELNIIDSQAACCGIAGTYGYKKEKYDIAMEVGQSLFQFILQDMADSPIVVCDSETCRWQITHATGKPAVHPVEIIAKSYGLPVEGALASI